MKNLYNITKGQLITLWVFGGAGWMFTWDSVDYEAFASFFFLAIPFILVFYTIGWRNHRKNQGN